jgi:urease accessory protein
VEDLALLTLLQLADSALPVGAAAHSFGLETMAEEGFLEPAKVRQFLGDYLEEAGMLEAVFLLRAHSQKGWAALNDELSARKPARESREASLKLGRRLADLVNAWLDRGAVAAGLHYCVAFGAAGAALGIPPRPLAIAYLQQSVMAMVSSCQRLMPLGQSAASVIVYSLAAPISRVASAATEFDQEVACFNPLPELSSMRHGFLETRLFIS